MSRFVALDKPEFIGHEAALKEKQEGPVKHLVLLEIDAADADVINDDPRPQTFEVETLGELRPASILTATPFDPQGKRIRG